MPEYFYHKQTLYNSGSVGRVLDLGSKGCLLQTHLRHCVVSVSKALYSLLSTGSTQEDLSKHNQKIVKWDVKHQHKKKKKHYELGSDCSLQSSLIWVNIVCNIGYRSTKGR